MAVPSALELDSYVLCGSETIFIDSFIVRCVETIDPTHCTRALHPWFPINLHGESFFRSNGDTATLSQSSTRMSQSSLNLAHVQTIFQSNDFDQIVSDICENSIDIQGVPVSAGPKTTTHPL